MKESDVVGENGTAEFCLRLRVEQPKIQLLTNFHVAGLAREFGRLTLFA
jgi:hypothetical protein